MLPKALNISKQPFKGHQVKPCSLALYSSPRVSLSTHFVPFPPRVFGKGAAERTASCWAHLDAPHRKRGHSWIPGIPITAQLNTVSLSEEWSGGGVRGAYDTQHPLQIRKNESKLLGRIPDKENQCKQPKVETPKCSLWATLQRQFSVLLAKSRGALCTRLRMWLMTGPSTGESLESVPRNTHTYPQACSQAFICGDLSEV